VKGAPVGRDAFRQAENEYISTGMYEANGTPKWGVQKNKDMKLQLTKFTAKGT
jgi:hypothetical protein